jgi:hypothetical protein
MSIIRIIADNISIMCPKLRSRYKQFVHEHSIKLIPICYYRCFIFKLFVNLLKGLVQKKSLFPKFHITYTNGG